MSELCDARVTHTGIVIDAHDSANTIETVLNNNASAAHRLAGAQFESNLRARQKMRPDADIRSIVDDLSVDGHVLASYEWLDDARFTYCASNRWLAVLELSQYLAGPAPRDGTDPVAWRDMLNLPAGWYLIGATGDRRLSLVGARCVGNDEPDWSNALYDQACKSPGFEATHAFLTCNGCYETWFSVGGRSDFHHTPAIDRPHRPGWILTDAQIHPDNTITCPYCRTGRITVNV
jgi:hypothetical protein